MPPVDENHFHDVLPCSVWYLDRDRNRQAAIVMSVDVMHPPASYCIRLEGADSTRDTEESRREPRSPLEQPISAQSTPEAMATLQATPGQAADVIIPLHTDESS